MTDKKAIKIIVSILDGEMPHVTFPKDTKEAFYRAMLALDKQIARECTDIQTPVVKWGICPSCKGLPMQLGRPRRIFAGDNYCPNCGQKILWKE